MDAAALSFLLQRALEDKGKEEQLATEKEEEVRKQKEKEEEELRNPRRLPVNQFCLLTPRQRQMLGLPPVAVPSSSSSGGTADVLAVLEALVSEQLPPLMPLTSLPSSTLPLWWRPISTFPCIWQSGFFVGGLAPRIWQSPVFAVAGGVLPRGLLWESGASVFSAQRPGEFHAFSREGGPRIPRLFFFVLNAGLISTSPSFLDWLLDFFYVKVNSDPEADSVRFPETLGRLSGCYVKTGLAS